MINNLGAAILAGGLGERIKDIYEDEPKPMVPFGGMSRLIDFSLNNCYQSGINKVLILTQYMRKPLIRYLLHEWGQCPGFKVHFGPFDKVYTSDFDQVFEQVQAPRERGTADAILKNAEYIFNDNTTDLLLLHSDHVYHFDYREMYRFHKQSKAALTIGYKDIDLEDVKLFGMVKFDQNQNLTAFVEKPCQPDTTAIFTAVCIINHQKLKHYLQQLQATDWAYDISKDVIPAMLKNKECIKVYPFKNYWKDVGTKKIYYHSNMALLNNDATMSFEKLPFTFLKKIKRQYIRQSGRIKNSIVAENACLEGKIENSIIYPGVLIDKDSLVQNSIIFPAAQIRGNSQVKHSIILVREKIDHKIISQLEPVRHSGIIK